MYLDMQKTNGKFWTTLQPVHNTPVHEQQTTKGDQ
jgi:hypothetical protein